MLIISILKYMLIKLKEVFLYLKSSLFLLYLCCVKSN